LLHRILLPLKFKEEHLSSIPDIKNAEKHSQTEIVVEEDDSEEEDKEDDSEEEDKEDDSEEEDKEDDSEEENKEGEQQRPQAVKKPENKGDEILPYSNNWEEGRLQECAKPIYESPEYKRKSIPGKSRKLQRLLESYILSNVTVPGIAIEVSKMMSGYGNLMWYFNNEKNLDAEIKHHVRSMLEKNKY